MTFHKFLTSAANDELKHLGRLLSSARDRRKSGLLVLEGFHLLQSALEAGWTVDVVYVNEAAQQHVELLPLLQRIAPTSRVLVSAAVLSKVTALASAPEVLAVCRRPALLPVVAGQACIMLDDVQDPGNLGTILRTAAAADVRAVFLSRGCVDAYSPKVLRAGMGAHFVLDIHEGVDLVEVLGNWRGLKVATHLEGSVSLYSQSLQGDVAFVFGNEGAGISPPVLAATDVKVRIPMPGHAESLNVAMAATVCLFERVRQGQL